MNVQVKAVYHTSFEYNKCPIQEMGPAPIDRPSCSR